MICCNVNIIRCRQANKRGNLIFFSNKGIEKDAKSTTKLVPAYFFTFPACLPDTFCISHTPISPATKTIKAHLCSATNPTVLPKKLKMAPTTFPTIAGNASTAFPASLLRASASLFNHLLKAPSSFGGETETPPEFPKYTCNSKHNC